VSVIIVRNLTLVLHATKAKRCRDRFENSVIELRVPGDSLAAPASLTTTTSLLNIFTPRTGGIGYEFIVWVLLSLRFDRSDKPDQPV
jgi:hypothetical protein